MRSTALIPYLSLFVLALPAGLASAAEAPEAGEVREKDGGEATGSEEPVEDEEPNRWKGLLDRMGRKEGSSSPESDVDASGGGSISPSLEERILSLETEQKQLLDKIEQLEGNEQEAKSDSPEDKAAQQTPAPPPSPSLTQCRHV